MAGNSHLIQNATVVSVDDKVGVRYGCDILVEDGVITAIDSDLKPPSGVPIIDASECIVSPGFVDTHRHTWESQLKNVTSDSQLCDYVLWIRNVYGSCYTSKDVYLGNLAGALESIDSGITCLVDHSHIMNTPAHADAAVEGLQAAKIRGVFCYGLYKNKMWPGVPPDAVQEETEPDWRLADAQRIRQKYFSTANVPSDLLRFGFAPAEIERSTVKEAIDQVEFGREIGAAIITGHISMGEKLDRGMHFIRHLQQNSLLGPDLLFSHCGALCEDELQAMHEHNVGISCTPDTELQMAMGPLIAFRGAEHGCKMSLGIDVACNNAVDMFQQMRLLLQNQRNIDNLAMQGPPNTISRKCEEVLRFATLGGAECMGLKDVVGSISVGKKADLLLTKCTSPRLTPIHDPVAALVLYANASDIDTVLIDGVIVKQGGKLVVADWSTVRKEVLQSSNNIKERGAVAPVSKINETILSLSQLQKKHG
ncbi:uncharacterized protein A1O9_06338 [Exophiala aquamarina CBS 119918]|uniref:Amidohydrolase-related domain-containing protein n=1 Tax=Exophiala aquamarina CBS 119918 TaxID=1182545 RepID=A0A072PF79_9EURO|nr:uncharacterized protein A1O9_06338 [Exophiala aquamarina CBS 119918]KEF58412.1 hypothetical protein A1O9_06338 [Exophiala aquamarina CBS 119918]